MTVNVEVPGIKTFTLEMQQTDYIGNIKYQLQGQVDIDLNKMDLLYNSEILSEVSRFSSGIIPDGATITMQTSDRWKYDEVNGVDNAAFSIARPKAETLKKIYAKDYGMSPSSGDNTAAFVNALKDCTADTYLVIEPGTYYFRGMTKDIEFNNMENVIIDGNDSTFIFDTKYCMKIYGGNGVEFRNLKVNWDWDTIPVGSLVQLTNKISNNQFEITFIGVDEVDENIPIGTFWYLDPETLTIGSLEKYKAYTPGSVEGCLQKVEKVDHNVLRITHNGNMKHFNQENIICFDILNIQEEYLQLVIMQRISPSIMYKSMALLAWVGYLAMMQIIFRLLILIWAWIQMVLRKEELPQPRMQFIF